MSCRYEEREIKQPKVIAKRLVEATCDVCGADAICVNPPDQMINGMRPWGVLDVVVQGTGGSTRIDLCRKCSNTISVNAGRGGDAT